MFYLIDTKIAQSINSFLDEFLRFTDVEPFTGYTLASVEDFDSFVSNIKGFKDEVEKLTGVTISDFTASLTRIERSEEFIAINPDGSINPSPSVAILSGADISYFQAYKYKVTSGAVTTTNLAASDPLRDFLIETGRTGAQRHFYMSKGDSVFGITSKQLYANLVGKSAGSLKEGQIFDELELLGFFTV